MLPKAIRLFAVLAGLLLFLGGLVVGQQMQRSKFAKYQEPTSVTEMRLRLLEANLEVVRAAIPAVDGMTVPTVAYQPSCRCFEADATLTDDELMKRPLQQVRTALMLPAVTARMTLKSEFPEMSDPQPPGGPDSDFRMTLWQVEKDFKVRKLFAELADGRLSFK